MLQADQVFAELLDAMARQDGERFVELCNENAELIFEQFASWRKIPEGIREQPQKLDLYFKTLIQTAQLFESAGYPQLLAILMPPGEENVLTKWQDQFDQARRLVESHDYEQCLLLADNLLDELIASKASGPGLIDLRAKLHGLRGETLFHLGRYTDARAATTLALEDCRLGGDQEGIEIYQANLKMLDAYAPSDPDLVDLELDILERFDRAQRLTELCRYRASTRVFAAILELNGRAAPLVDSIRRHILGRMGFNEFKLGNVDSARQLIAEAQALSSAQNDRLGVEVYAENLQGIDKYFQDARPPIQQLPPTSLWGRFKDLFRKK